MDAEVRRLKNRVRQQRYRARKREEKAKTDSYAVQGAHTACHGSLSQCLPLMGMPNMVNGLPALKYDIGSIYAKPIQEKNQTIHPRSSDNCGNETRKDADLVYGGIENCSEGSDSHPRESRQQQQTVHVLKMVVQGDGGTSLGSYHPSFQALKPSSKMEDGHHVNTQTKLGRSKSHYDIMARRQKNRERQRRYRARKRLAADMQSADLRNQYTSLRSHMCGVVVDSNSRPHHHRDWKKDARQAHIVKEQKTAEIPAAVLSLATEPAVHDSYLEGFVHLKHSVNLGGHEANDSTHVQRTAEIPAPALSLASEHAAHDSHDVQVKVPYLECVVHLEHFVNLNGHEANDSPHGRRHWKAAARNKVD